MAWFDLFDQWMIEHHSDIRIEKDADMKKYTSFRIGGAAKRMVFPQNEDALTAVVEACSYAGTTYYVIGRGSNLLVSDAGLDYVIINMTEMDTISLRDDFTIYVQSGAPLSRLAVQAQEAGYAGLAFAHGIPGSVGGAVMMNAGAYGGEMCQVVEQVTALFPDGIRTLTGEQLHFGYRHSVFMEQPGVILSAVLRLKAGAPEEIRAEMDDYMARRKASQRLEYHSAGSTFKRPEGYFAGTMIDQCGLKGTTVGGAQVSEKHAGFIINKNQAAFDDVVTLIGIVQDTVYRTFGVELEPEVRIIQ